MGYRWLTLVILIAICISVVASGCSNNQDESISTNDKGVKVNNSPVKDQPSRLSLEGKVTKINFDKEEKYLEISKELERNERVIFIPISWSQDSKRLYYILYQHDKAVPIELFMFEDKRKIKISQIDYRKEYNHYHLGISIYRTAWSPARDKLAFIMEHNWGALSQLIILNLKTGKIDLILDDIVDFDWHPYEENKIAVVKKLKSRTLDTAAMIYDLESNEFKKSALIPDNISSIAFDADGDLYYAEVESEKVYQVNTSGNKKFIGKGLSIVPSIDRKFLALVKGTILSAQENTDPNDPG